MSSIPTEAATLPSPKPGDSDAVGTTTKKEQGSTFKGSVPEGSIQPGVLVDMKYTKGPNKFKPGEDREQCIWLFQIEGRETEGEFAVYTSFSLHEKSSLPPVLDAMQRPYPEVGEPLRKSVYVGAKVGLLIETPKGKQFQKVTRVLRRA